MAKQHCLIATFGAAIQANNIQDYPGGSTAALPVSSTVHATFNAVAQAYWAQDHPAQSMMLMENLHTFYSGP